LPYRNYTPAAPKTGFNSGSCHLATTFFPQAREFRWCSIVIHFTNNPAAAQAAFSRSNRMKKPPASSTPVPAVSPIKSNPFTWPRRPTPVPGQVPFNFEDIEEKGDAPCE
jgi:hypothetical protein